MFSFKKLIATVTLSTACTIPCFSADAATIAVIPLINNVADYKGADAVYFDRAVEALKKNGNFEIAEDNVLDKAIAKYTKEGILPDTEALKAICEEGNVDAVFAYYLEELKDEQTLYGTEWTYKVYLRGKVAAYNMLSNKPVKNNKVVETVERPYSESARFNVKEEIFADSVTREINRVIGNKKLNLSGPKISARGQKGDR